MFLRASKLLELASHASVRRGGGGGTLSLYPKKPPGSKGPETLCSAFMLWPSGRGTTEQNGLPARNGLFETPHSLD